MNNRVAHVVSDGEVHLCKTDFYYPNLPHRLVGMICGKYYRVVPYDPAAHSELPLCGKCGRYFIPVR